MMVNLIYPNISFKIIALKIAQLKDFKPFLYSISITAQMIMFIIDLHSTYQHASNFNAKLNISIIWIIQHIMFCYLDVVLSATILMWQEPAKLQLIQILINAKHVYMKILTIHILQIVQVLTDFLIVLKDAVDGNLMVFYLVSKEFRS